MTKKRIHGSGIPLGWTAEVDPIPRMGFRRRITEPAKSIRALVEDSSENHLLVVAPTGAGKGRHIIIPTLLYDEAPAVVLDIKGEAAAVTAAYRRKAMKHEVTIIDPWKRVKGSKGQFNPLQILKVGSPSMADDAFALASLLKQPGASPNDPYWNERAESLIAGLMVYVATSPKEEARDMGRVHALLHMSDLVFSLARILDDNPEMDQFAYSQIAALVGLSADNTRHGIISTAQSLVRCFASEAVKAAFAATSFDVDRFVSGAAQTIFIVVPPDKLESHASILRLWISALINIVTSRNTRPPCSTLFIVDEVAQLGPMPQMKQAVTLTRGYGVRTMLFLQSPSQLKTLFLKDSEVITENCGTLITFGHLRAGMSKSMAEIYGDITADTLATMSNTQLAVKEGGAQTRILDRVDYLSHSPFATRAQANPMFSSASLPGTIGAEKQ